MTDAHSPATIARTAAHASRILKSVAGAERDAALTAIHDALATHRDAILIANQQDMVAARQLVAAGMMQQSLAKRLVLNQAKLEDMLRGILDVRDLPDPGMGGRTISLLCYLTIPLVGRVTYASRLDTGLDLYRVTSPIGTLLVIFEARPEVIANITALALKSGNTVILKGGKESTNSFTAISRIVSSALASTSIPPGAVQLVETREDVDALLAQDEYIDLIVPRGSNELVRYIKEHTKIPVLGHADGLCSIYVHSDADPEKVANVVVDAKTDYPAACNSMETLLIHESLRSTLLPMLVSKLSAGGVSVRCDAASKAALTASPLYAALKTNIQDASLEDYDTEFLDLICVLKLVPGVNAAIEHINSHSSGHTDCILTEDNETAEAFMNRVDSAGVFWNASTRFADGFRYGFGTEVGISTSKIHARGPVGLEGLVIYKYQLRGRGQGAGMYGEGKKTFLHEKIEGIERL